MITYCNRLGTSVFLGRYATLWWYRPSKVSVGICGGGRGGGGGGVLSANS